MNSFIKSTPIVLILILCSSNSYSEPVRLEKSQIKFQSSNNLKSIGFKLDSSSNTFSKFTEAANFEHIPTGAKARINAKITASVSRAGVLSGVGKLVRQGAKFGTRAVPYVGTALLAHDVYETFKEDIKARGCRYDPETDKFVKGYEYANCLPPVAFRNAEDNRFSCRAATASAFTPYAETASARPGGALENLIGSQGQTMVGNRADFTVKQCRRIGMDTQNIGGRTGGNFRYKRTERFFLYFFL
ncbi:protein TspB2 [Neisseria gonorrhoeae]|nr:protein TspB2 [Neisseria gonorrhoeae]